MTNVCNKVLVSSGLRNLQIRLMLRRWKKSELQSLLIWVDILSWEWNPEPRFLTTGLVYTTDSPTVILLMSTLASCYLVPRSKTPCYHHLTWCRSLIIHFLKSMMQSRIAFAEPASSPCTFGLKTTTIAYHRRMSAPVASVDPQSRIICWYILWTEAGQGWTLEAPLARAKRYLTAPR